MCANPWEYTPLTTYRQKRADQLQQEMKLAAVKSILQRTGGMFGNEIARRLPASIFDAPPVRLGSALPQRSTYGRTLGVVRGVGDIVGRSGAQSQGLSSLYGTLTPDWSQVTQPDLTGGMAMESARGLIKRQQLGEKKKASGGFLDTLGGVMGVAKEVAGVIPTREGSPWPGIESAAHRITGFTRQDVMEATEDPLFRFATSGKVALGLAPSGDPNQIRAPGFVQAQFNKFPSWLKDVVDVGAAPTTVATAAVGGPVGAMFRNTKYLSGLAPLVEPILSGNLATRFAGEVAAGAGGLIASRETLKRLPQGTPGPVRMGVGIGAGLLGGLGAVAGLRASQRVGASLLTRPPLDINERVLTEEPFRLTQPIPEGPGATALGANGTGPYVTGRYAIGDIDWSGADEIIRTKQETLRQPGAIGQRTFQYPIIRKGVSVLNPSVDMDRDILVAVNAKSAAAASLITDFDSVRLPLVRRLQDAWDAATPRYVGPVDNPFKSTIKDFADNPEFYTNVSADITNAARRYDEASLAVIRVAREKFGVDIAPFDSGKPGSFYLSTMETREALEKKAEEAGRQYSSQSLGGKTTVAKERAYDSAYERWKRNPSFSAETDLQTLTSTHDNGISNMAGNQTFRRAAGGKTRVEVIDELRPNLRNTKENYARQIDNAKARLTTAENRLRTYSGMEGRWQTELKRQRAKAQPLLDRIDELIDANEYGPELSYLSGQVREINARVATIDRLTTKTQAKRLFQEAKAGQTRQLIDALAPKLDQLRQAYRTAGTGEYVLNTKTYRYHTAAANKAIDGVLRTDLGAFDGLSSAMDEIRMVAFSADFSPLTIQGSLGAAADPVTLAMSARKIIDQVATGSAVERIAAQEPDLVRRFVIATGRPFGSVTAELAQQGKGFERQIPFTKLSPGRAMNDRLMGALEVMRYQSWKNDVSILKALNPGMADNIIDAEAANNLSKIIPAINFTEQGRSQAAQKAWRTIPGVISPSFTTAPPLLIKDMASGFVKLAAARTLNPIQAMRTLSGREQLAVIRGVSMFGTLALISATSAALSAEARGKSVPESVMDAINPVKGDFLSIQLGDKGKIPIGGPFRSFLRGMAPRIDSDGNVVPFAGFASFLRGKIAPTQSTIIDLIRNKDYLGRKIVKGEFPTNILTGAWYAGERMLPLSAGVVSELARTGELRSVGQVAKQVGSQFAGTSYYERSAGEVRAQRLDEIARQMFAGQPTGIEGQTYPKNVRYDDLNKTDQQKVKSDPRITSIEFPEGEGANIQQRMDIAAENYDRRKLALETDLKQVLSSRASGEEKRKAIQDYKDRKSEAYESTWGGPALQAEFAKGDKKKLQDAMRDAYWSVEVVRGADGELDFNARDAQREEILAQARAAGVSEEYVKTRSYESINDPDLRAIIKQYDSDMEKLKPYWNITDTTWEQMRKKYKELAPYATIDDYAASREQDYIAKGVPEEYVQAIIAQRDPVIQGVMSAAGRFKLDYRIKNPEQDALLIKWGYLSIPVTMRDTGTTKRPKSAMSQALGSSPFGGSNGGGSPFGPSGSRTAGYGSAGYGSTNRGYAKAGYR